MDSAELLTGAITSFHATSLSEAHMPPSVYGAPWCIGIVGRATPPPALANASTSPALPWQRAAPWLLPRRARLCLRTRQHRRQPAPQLTTGLLCLPTHVQTPPTATDLFWGTTAT